MAGMQELLERLVTDRKFRAALEKDPQAALAGYELSDNDREMLAAQLSTDAGTAGTVEQRTSKSALLAALGALTEGLEGTAAGEATGSEAISAPPAAEPDIESAPNEKRSSLSEWFWKMSPFGANPLPPSSDAGSLDDLADAAPEEVNPVFVLRALEGRDYSPTPEEGVEDLAAETPEARGSDVAVESVTITVESFEKGSPSEPTLSEDITTDPAEPDGSDDFATPEQEPEGLLLPAVQQAREAAGSDAGEGGEGLAAPEEGVEDLATPEQEPEENLTTWGVAFETD